MMKTVSMRIEGRVQGVGYRDWTRSEAIARDLSGWVRNCDDGSVAALFHGLEAAVDDMVAACARGPAPARVASARASEAAPPAQDGFEVLR